MNLQCMHGNLNSAPAKLNTMLPLNQSHTGYLYIPSRITVNSMAPGFYLKVCVNVWSHTRIAQHLKEHPVLDAPLSRDMNKKLLVQQHTCLT